MRTMAVNQQSDPAEKAERVPRWERRPGERPQEILDAALRVFADRGYRVARLEEIAEAAGVTKGTLYRYFKSKSELLFQAVERRQELRAARFQQMTAEATGPASEKLRALVTGAVREALEPEQARVMRLVTGELSQDAPDLAKALLRKTVVRGWQHIQRLIEEGQAAGEFRADADAEMIARLFMSGMVHQAQLLTHPCLGDAAPASPERLAEAAIDFLLQGLRPVG